MTALLSPQEDARLMRLADCAIVDTPAEQRFDDLVQLAARTCEVPIALLSFVAGERVWFKSRLGFPLRGVPRSESICTHAIREDRQLVVPDLLADTRFADSALAHGATPIRSYAGAVVRTTDGHALGVLAIADCAPRDYTERELWTLGALADQVVALLELRTREQELDALASERALPAVLPLRAANDPAAALAHSERERLALLGLLEDQQAAERQLRLYARRLRELSRRMVEMEETEKRNIGRDLHDHIGSALAALNLSLDMVQAQLTPETAVAARLGEARAQAQNTVRELRHVLDALRPPALDDFGLLAAVREYGTTFGRQVGIPVRVIGHDPDPRPPLAAETALFRIAQEALNNATRHGRCTRITVRLGHEEHLLTLRISDDGRGFDEERAEPGWGLKTMRERAEAIGAELTVITTIGAGTEIVVSLPLEYDDDPIIDR